MPDVIHEVKSVFVVQHVHRLPQGEDNVKMIGVYASRNSAESAANCLATQPGFSDHSKIIDHDLDKDDQGFHIEEYEIGKDHWTEGYVTVR